MPLRVAQTAHIALFYGHDRVVQMRLPGCGCGQSPSPVFGFRQPRHPRPQYRNKKRPIMASTLQPARPVTSYPGNRGGLCRGRAIEVPQRCRSIDSSPPTLIGHSVSLRGGHFGAPRPLQGTHGIRFTESMCNTGGSNVTGDKSIASKRWRAIFSSTITCRKACVTSCRVCCCASCSYTKQQLRSRRR